MHPIKGYKHYGTIKKCEGYTRECYLKGKKRVSKISNSNKDSLIAKDSITVILIVNLSVRGSFTIGRYKHNHLFKW